MPRSNILAQDSSVVTANTGKFVYADESTINDLIRDVLEVGDLKEKISDYESLHKALEYVLKQTGGDLEYLEKPLELNRFLRSLPGDKTIGEFGSEIKTEPTEQVGETKMESKVPNRDRLKELERLYIESLEREGQKPKTDHRESIRRFIKQQQLDRVLEKELTGRLEEINTLVETDGLEPAKARDLIEVREEIGQVVSREVGQEEVQALAKAIIEKDPDLPNLIEDLAADNEVKVVIGEMAEGVIATEQLNAMVGEAVDRIVEKHQDIAVDDPDEVKVFKESLEERIKNEVLDPFGEQGEKSIKFELGEDGKLKINTVNETNQPTGKFVLNKGGGLQMPRSTTEEPSVKKTGALEREIEQTVNKIREDSSSSKVMLDKLRKDLMNPEYKISIKQIHLAQQYVRTPQDIQQQMNIAEENGFPREMVRNELPDVLAKVIQGKKDAGDVAGGISKIREITRGKIGAINKVDDAIKKVTAGADGVKKLRFVQEIEKIRKMADTLSNSLNPLKFLKIPGLEKFAANFGMQSTSQMATAIASQIATHGFRKGLEISLQGILAGGKVAMATAGTGAATGTAVGTGAAVASATIPVAGWIIALVIVAAQALAWLGGKIIGALQDGYDGIMGSLGLDTGGLGVGLRKTFGKTLGGAMDRSVQGIGIVTGAMLAIPAIIGGLLVIPAVAVFGLIAIVALPSLITHGDMEKIIALTPNKATGAGYCVDIGIGETGGSGNINCDTTVEDQTGTSVDKENFIDVAGRWRSGGEENARLCFNDVVKRANDRGINADYALWVWLHESGASNYKGFSSPVADFGVIYKPYNDFNLQIDELLGLDPASKCIGDPRIDGDYWLAFAANYLNGTGNCDPDLPNAASNNITPREYLEEMRATWSWIASAPMPDKIQTVSSGGGGSSSKPPLTVITDPNGNRSLCELVEGSNGSFPNKKPLPTLDPRITIPEGCPDRVPLADPRANRNITQGPHCSKYSHSSMGNAVDFGIMGDIVATHNGIARVGANSTYGNFVDVTGKCNGVTFTTRYAHMPDGGPKVGDNVKVTAGQVIGRVNNTGNSSGDHLHYDVRGVTAAMSFNISRSLKLTYDLEGCCNRTECNP